MADDDHGSGGQSTDAPDERRTESARRPGWLAEDVLSTSEEAFRLAFENASVGICLVSRDGRLLRVNREMSEMFGYAKSELEGMSVNDIAHPDFKDVSPTFIRPASAGEGDRAEFEKAYIHREGRLMGSLVDGLLDFNQTGRRQLVRNPLDMKRLAQRIGTDLVSQPEGQRVNLVVADLSPALADRGLVASVLRHLISNTIRFSSGRPEAVVEVGSQADPGTPAYFVRDHGIGFDERCSDKLFGVFQRLEAPPEAGRTGIGLALVKKIVERHGGRVWAEGAVNEGATFSFTLPVEERADPGVPSDSVC